MRRIYRVRWNKDLETWDVLLGSAVLARRPVKSLAVAEGRRIARASWYSERRRSQLRIFGRNGRIQTEHTYGKDPRRSPG